MGKDCISARQIRDRGLIVSSGDISQGSCSNGLDAKDQATLADEWGQPVYDSKNSNFSDLANAFRYFNDPEAVSTYPLAQQTLLAPARGQIFAFGPECQVKQTAGTSRFSCPATEANPFVVDSLFKVDWGREQTRMRREVRNKYGEMLRLTEKAIPHSIDRSSLTTTTTWYVDGHTFLQADDYWPYGVLYGSTMPEAAGKIILREMNPCRLGEGQESTLAFPSPHQRLGFYQSVDQWIGSHEIGIDPSSRSAIIDGQSLFLANPLDGSLIDEEAADILLGALYFLPFSFFTPLDRARIYVGEPGELVDLASSEGVSSNCIEGVRDFFPDQDPVNNQWITAGKFCIDEQMIFLRSHRSEYEGTARGGHRHILAHELGHLLYFDNPDLSGRFRPIYWGYASTSFTMASIREGSADRDFLMAIVNRGDLISKLPDDDQKKLGAIWDAHNLQRYFPSKYSLSNADEFFAELVESYRPWHAFEADQKPYYGFFDAMDSLTVGDTNGFYATIETRYPNLPTPPPAPSLEQTSESARKHWSTPAASFAVGLSVGLELFYKIPASWGSFRMNLLLGLPLCLSILGILYQRHLSKADRGKGKELLLISFASAGFSSGLLIGDYFSRARPAVEKIGRWSGRALFVAGAAILAHYLLKSDSPANKPTTAKT